MKLARVAVLTLSAAALALAVTGCANGQLPPSVRESRVDTTSTESTAEVRPASSAPASSAPASPAAAPSAEAPSAAQYSGTITEDAVALGTEMQRTSDGKVGAEVWVMSTAGKADLVGSSPQLALVAVAKSGAKRVVWSGATSPAGSGPLATQQVSFVVPVPADTVQLVLSTSLHEEGGSAKTPVLGIQLADVPVVKTIDVTVSGASR